MPETEMTQDDQVLAAEREREEAIQREMRAKEEESRRREETERIAKSEESRIRAEAERDLLAKALQEVRNQNSGQATWTPEQWQQLESTTGITKQAVEINAGVAANIADAKLAAFSKQIEEKMSATEKRAREAEEKLSRFESTTAFDKTRTNYYSKKPELARHDKDVQEFISKFPESSRDTPEKLNELFGMAETYVRGKVGMKSVSSQRFSNDAVPSEPQEDDDLDLSSLDESERRTFSDIIPSKEDLKSLKGLTTKDGSGIILKGEDEWAAARNRRSKQSVK